LSCHQGTQPAALHQCDSPAQTQHLSANDINAFMKKPVWEV
jgi:hypothetical protein